MDEDISDFEVISQKADSAWNALQQQYAGRLTDAEIDYLFARLVLGMTSPFYADREPDLHFGACAALVGRKLPPERLRAALHAVPAPSQPWVARAFAFAEDQGTKIGATLTQRRDRTDDEYAEADAAHRELSSGAEEQVG